MARPVEILPRVIRGLRRDTSVDALPDGYLWDLADYIPMRNGAKAENRGQWSYFTANLGGPPSGGSAATYIAGDKLMIVADGRLKDINLNTGAITDAGAMFAQVRQNGVKLGDAVYFLDGQGLLVPKKVTFDGGVLTITNVNATAAKGSVGIAYKERLVTDGGPGARSRLIFSPLLIDGGPGAAYDVESNVNTSDTITGLAALQRQIIVFHPGSIERIRGAIAPATNIDSDFYVDTLTDQIGCTQPLSIVPWNENVIFANERGVYMTEGSVLRNLTDEGGIQDYYRDVYKERFEGNSVHCGIYVDYLMVSILSAAPGKSILLVCDLNSRSWFRFTNFAAQIFIASAGADEELYAAIYAEDRLTRVSEMFRVGFEGLETEIVDRIDGNGQAVLPLLETGWLRIGREGQRQFRDLYLSYQREPSAAGPLLLGSMKVEFRHSPPRAQFASGDYELIGYVDDSRPYLRKRLPIRRRGYGVQFRVSGTKPCAIQRIFSMEVSSTAQDRSKTGSVPPVHRAK